MEKISKCKLCQFQGICTPSLCDKEKQVLADKINAMNEIIQHTNTLDDKAFGILVVGILEKYNLVNKSNYES